MRRRSDDNGRATAEDDDTEKRRAATLALLRKKYKDGEKESGNKAVTPMEPDEETRPMDEVPAAPAEPISSEPEEDEEEQKENVGVPAPVAEPVKTFGRRLKRLGGGEAAAPAQLPSMFDDLEDF